MSEEFKDRQSEFPNRRRIKIISQTPNEIIADIERSEGNVLVEGTQLTASVLNAWNENITTAKSNAEQAINNSNNAVTISSDANTNSEQALTKATNAETIANSSYEKAIQVELALADRGTTVYVDSQPQSTVVFSGDPQTQIDENVTNINALTSTVSQLDLGKVKKDASDLTEQNVLKWKEILGITANETLIANNVSLTSLIDVSSYGNLEELFNFIMSQGKGKICHGRVGSNDGTTLGSLLGTYSNYSAVYFEPIALNGIDASMIRATVGGITAGTVAVKYIMKYNNSSVGYFTQTGWN